MGSCWQPLFDIVRKLIAAERCTIDRKIVPVELKQLDTPWRTRVYRNFPDWQPGARISNGTALCHYVQSYC